MGFRRDKSIIVEFDEKHPSHGLVVRMKPMSVGQMDRLIGLQTELRQAGVVSSDGASARRELCALLADNMRSWNLEDDDSGEPVPPTRDGVMTQEFPFVLEVLEAWLAHVMGVPEESPLEGQSSDGETRKPPEELTLPQESLSESPGS